MNKDEIIQQLLLNPTYDSDWVNKASDLMVEHGLTEQELSKYNAQQLSMLIEVYKQFGDESATPDLDFIDLISNPKLNVTQMQLLFTAKVKAGLDNRRVRILADPELPYVKGNYIAQAMVDGFFMAEIIAINEFSVEQIYEIYCGFKSEVNYNAYADSSIPAESMSLIRHAMELGYQVTYDTESKGIAAFPQAKEM